MIEITAEQALFWAMILTIEFFAVAFFYQHLFIVRRGLGNPLPAPAELAYVPTMTFECDRYTAKVTRYSNGHGSPHKSPVHAEYVRSR